MTVKHNRELHSFHDNANLAHADLTVSYEQCNNISTSQSRDSQVIAFNSTVQVPLDGCG